MSFPRYPAYKNSGVEWLGEVPGHWVTLPLSRTASSSKSLFIDGDWIESKDLSDDGIRYLTSGNIGEGYYKEQGQGYISEETFAALNCVEVVPGDVLISRLNLPIGRSCLVPDLGGRIVSCVDNVIVRPDSDFDRRFLVYQLTSKAHFANMENLARGTTMQRISRSALGRVRFAFPPLPEQTQIAAFLDRETAKIDALVAEQRRLMELLKEKRQAVISHAVTRGLNPDAPLKPSCIEWLGDVPAHWRVVPLRWAAKCCSGDGLSSAEVESSGDDEHSVRVIGGNGLMGYTNQKNVEHSVLAVGRVGALCGNVHIVHPPAWITDNALVLDPDSSIFNLQFLSLTLRSRNLNDIASKTAQPLITGTQVSDQRIPCPPIAEQQAIALHLHQESAKFDTLTTEAQRAIDLLQERRTALISAAVTGQIDVRGAVPC